MYVNDSDEPRGTLAYVDNFPAEAAAELDALRAERDQFKAMWERDSTALGKALAQRDTARTDAEDKRARVAELEERLDAMIPLFEEARDALPAITLESAKLRGIRLDLADRMDDVGDPERWAARKSASAASADIDAARAAEAKK